MRKGLLDISPLRTSPAFRRLWIGTVAIRFSGQMAIVAVLHQVWELTKSPLWTVRSAWRRPLRRSCSAPTAERSPTRDRRRVVLLTSSGAIVAAGLLAVRAVAGIESALLVLALVAAQTSCTALG